MLTEYALYRLIQLTLSSDSKNNLATFQIDDGQDKQESPINSRKRHLSAGVFSIGLQFKVVFRGLLLIDWQMAVVDFEHHGGHARAIKTPTTGG